MIWKMLKNLHREDSGQDLIEYALLAALIALASTAAMTTLAGQVAYGIHDDRQQVDLV